MKDVVEVPRHKFFSPCRRWINRIPNWAGGNVHAVEWTPTKGLWPKFKDILFNIEGGARGRGWDSFSLCH